MLATADNPDPAVTMPDGKQWTRAQASADDSPSSPSVLDVAKAQGITGLEGEDAGKLSAEDVTEGLGEGGSFKYGTPAAAAVPAAKNGDSTDNLTKLRTAAASGAADPSINNPATATAGAARVAQSGLSDSQKAAIYSGLAIKYASLPGVGSMFSQMAQHYLQQADLPQSYKEWLLTGGGQTYAEFLDKSKTPQGQQNIEYAKEHWQELGLPDPKSKDPKDQQAWRDYSAKALGLVSTPQSQVDVHTGESMATTAAKSLSTNYDAITSGSGAVAMLTNANRLQERLNDPRGMITGWGTGQAGIENFANIMATLGFGDPSKISNTQEFTNSAMTDVVTAARTMFPGGRITNADLNMAKISQGLSTDQQKEVIQEAVRIAHDRALAAIDAHNDKVQRFDKKYPDMGAGDLYTVRTEQIPAPADGIEPLVRTQADFDRLPPNTKYRHQDGTTSIKP